MLNQSTIIGFLTADPELKYTPNDKEVVNFTVAVNEVLGAGKKEVNFIPVVAWGGTAKAVCNFLKKGSQCCVTGRLTIKQWEKDGVKRNKAEINAKSVIFLSGGKQAGDDNADAGADDDEPF